MAKPKSRMISKGDAQDSVPHKTSQRMMERLSRKGKKPMKSNVTNKVKRGPMNLQTTKGGVPGEIGDEDDADEAEHHEPADEPAVSTLPGASQADLGEDTPRLAGFQVNDDDMFNEVTMVDDIQANAGAIDADGSDDGYADVENVSDSEASEDEDNEQNILRSAEKDLIEEFERTEERQNTNIMLNGMHEMGIGDDDNDPFAHSLAIPPAESQFDGLGFTIDMNEDPFLGLAKNDSLYNDLWNEAESEMWRRPDVDAASHLNNGNGNLQKRVRFEETHSRDISVTSSEEANNAFPDLFASSDDPAVKQQLALIAEQDLELAQHEVGDADSFYDFEDEDEKLAFEVDENSDSEYDSSTYDSDDEGDTTDEETREEQIARLEERKKAAGALLSKPPSTPDMSKRQTTTAASTPPSRRPTTPKSGKGPITGVFEIDPTRAAMTMDSEGRNIKLFPPSKPAEKDKAFWDRARTASSSRASSPPESPYLKIPNPADDNQPPRPFTAQSTLGSMFNGNLDILRNNDSSGIAEDLFPATLSRHNTSFTSTTDASDNELNDINMQDFVDLYASDSDSDDPVSAGITSPTEQDMHSSLNSSGLLDHFDQCRGVVGSFRQNQHNARHFSSLPLHPAKRASAHEYNALQKGKRGAANTPMTPARRKRISQDLSSNTAGVRKSISSPLTSRRPRSRGNSLVGIANADLLQTLARNPFD